MYSNLFSIESSYEFYQGLRESDKENMDILERMSLETEIFDANINVDLAMENTYEELSSYEIISRHFSVEGITDTIKQKGKRAIYSAITMIKKALNFMFGFIISLFKGSVNTKATLEKVYKKAKDYREKVSQLASKKFPDDFEMESKDYAKRSNASLMLLRSIIDMVQECVKQANEVETDDALTRGVKLSFLFSDLLGSITDDDAKASPSDVIADTKSAKGATKDTNIFKRFIKGTAEGIKSGWNGTIEFLKGAGKGVAEASKDVKDNVSASVKFKFKKDPSGYIQIIEKRTNKIKELVEQYSAEPEEKTVKAVQLFPYYVNQLDLFLTVIKSNKWDFSKAIKSLEGLRTKSIKAVDKIKIDENANEKEKENQSNEIRYSLQLLTAMGKSISGLTPLVKQLLNNVNNDIESLMTEIAKCGSKASKI